MILTPVLKALAPRLADALAPLVPLRLRQRKGIGMEAATAKELRDHVVIIGYGLNGRNLSQALKRVSIPYVAIEMNPETVRKEAKAGEPMLYGDASNPEVLEHAGIRRARVLVIAVSDPSSIRRSTELARRLNPSVHIIVRTRFLGEMKPLQALGADEVVPEEFETSLEIFSRTLKKLLVPRDVVDRFVREARVNNYGALVAPHAEPEAKEGVGGFVAGADLEVLRVEPGSRLAGKSLEDASLRRHTGATVLAVRVGSEFHSNPSVTAPLAPGTVAIVFGTPEQVAAAAAFFRAPEKLVSDTN
jgi:CPA2 family monovalent cation:H+ antiporter-2